MPLLDSPHLTSARTSYIRRALRNRIPFAVATMSFALFGLFANGAAPMLGIPQETAATHPLTALCLFGLGYWSLRMNRFGQPSLGRHIMVGLVLMICCARVMGALVSPAPLAIFGPIGLFGGQFSVEAGLALGAFAAAALVRQSQGRIGTGFVVVGLAVVYNALIEVGYGVTFFQGEVSVFTILSLVAASVTMLSIYVHRPFVRVAFLMGDLGSQVRMMAAAAVVIPLAGGFILHVLKPQSNVGFPAEAALSSAVTWGLLVVLLVSSARLESTAVARRRTLRDIAMQSRIDPLTKALNRFGMMETLEGAWLDFRSTGTKFGLILLDLDYFKRLNETFGHDAGDDVLERVSATLHPHLRDSDALGRWGGGEFLILLKIKKSSDINVVATRLHLALEALDSPFGEGLNGLPAQITATLGLSEMQDNDHGAVEAISRADVALGLEREQSKWATGTAATEQAFEADSAAA